MLLLNPPTQTPYSRGLLKVPEGCLLIRRALLRACQIISHESKIEQEANTTTVELKQRLCNCWCFCWLVVYCCCFLFNCCLLLKQSLTLRGLSGSPGTWPSPVVSLFGDTFFQLVFLHSFFQQKTTFVANWTPKMTPKSIPNLALDQFFWFFAHAACVALHSVVKCFHCSHLFKNTQKAKQKQSLENTMKNIMTSCKKQKIFRQRLPNQMVSPKVT